MGCIALIVLVGAGVYLNSFAGIFLLDDNGQILENTRIRELTPIADWLSTRRPVVSLSLAINYHFGQLRPWGYHLFNLVVHLLASLTLFGIIRRTMRLGNLRTESLSGSSGNAFAFAVALIWIVHPLQTQSVSYVIQRGESMMGLFYLLTLYCTIRGATCIEAQAPGESNARKVGPSPSTTPMPMSQKARRLGWFAAAILACSLGMGSKAVMATAPLVVLLYDWTFLSGSLAATLRRRWALYLGLVATWAVLWAVGIAGLFKSSGTAQASAGFSTQGISSWHYLLTQPGVILHYLRLCLWPVGQCLDYAWTPVERLGDAAFSGAAIVALLAGAIWAYIRRRQLGFLSLWVFIILAPTSSFIPIKDPAFEHRMYLPLAAVVALSITLGHWLLLHLGNRLSWIRSARRPLASVILGVMVIVLGSLTVRRNRVYHSSEAMWRNVLVQSPNNARAFLGLGRALDRQGRTAEAMQLYQRAVLQNAGYAEARTNLGLVLDKLGRTDEAIRQLQMAIRSKPKLMKAYRNLADVYVNGGHLERGKTAYRDALKINPRWALGHTRLGIILALQGQQEAAIEQFHEAIRIDPKLSEPHLCLGFALQEQGHVDDALREYRAVLRLDKTHSEARQRLDALRKERDGEK